MFQNENKYNNSIKIINHENKENKNNNIIDIQYDNQEEFNDLNDFNTQPWTNAQGDFSESNFNLTAKIETVNLNKNIYIKKEEEPISPKGLSDGDGDSEEIIYTSFNQDISFNSNIFTKSKKTFLKKKRKKQGMCKECDILTPIPEDKCENKKNEKNKIFKITKKTFKITKKNIHKIELFKYKKYNEFNPPFKELKQEQENTPKFKKKQKHQEIDHIWKKKLTRFKTKKVSTSQPKKFTQLK